MSKAKPRQGFSLAEDWRKIPVPLGLVAAGGALIFWLVANVALKDEVQAAQEKILIVQVKVQSLYDARIEQLTIQRDRLLRGPQTTKTKADLADIERELALARKMREAERPK